MFWPLKERAIEYRRSIKRNDGTGPVARPFKEKQHISSLFFIGTEVINPVKEVVMSILSGKGERHFGFFFNLKSSSPEGSLLRGRTLSMFYLHFLLKATSQSALLYSSQVVLLTASGDEVFDLTTPAKHMTSSHI